MSLFGFESNFAHGMKLPQIMPRIPGQVVTRWSLNKDSKDYPTFLETHSETGPVLHYYISNIF